jgi:hypothetical protein
MKRAYVIFPRFFVIALILQYSYILTTGSEIVPGATGYDISCGCELIHFDESIQMYDTWVVACPGIDMIRL